MISLPSLLDVGAGASVGYGATLRPWVVVDGWVLVEPITIGDGAFVGAGSVLAPGTVVGDRAVLAEQSTAVRGQRIPADEYRAGAPSAPSDRVDPMVGELAGQPPLPGWTPRQRDGAVAGLALLEGLVLLRLRPGRGRAAGGPGTCWRRVVRRRAGGLP